MEESNGKSTILDGLYDMYVKIKVEIKCQYEKGNRNDGFFFQPILKCIEDKIQTVKKESESFAKLQAAKASIFFEHAKILIALQDSNDKLCLQFLWDALALIGENKLNYQITYLHFRIGNILSYTLSKINKIEESLKLLEEAEALYMSIPESEKCDILVYNTEEFLRNIHESKEESIIKFEKLITNNLQIQAWVYNKMNLSKKFLRYHHIVLNRQLEMQDGNALSWFYKCARLGVYFFSNNRFIEGKHHLAAAAIVLREYELEMLKHRSEPNFVTDWNNLRKYYADLGKYWGKYGLFLFNASRHLAVAQINSEIDMNDVLITSFQDSPSNGPAREWFNIRKNSMFFPCSHNTKSSQNVSRTSTNINKHQAKQTYKILVGDLNEQKQQESETDIKFTTKIDKKPDINIVNNIQQEIDKLNEEADINASEEITEVTKMIIDALDDRQKEVDSENGVVNGDQNGAKIEENTALKQNDDQPIDSKKQDSTETSKIAKETGKKESKTSNTSAIPSTSSRNDDDVDYEFKFPSLDMAQFDDIPVTLISSTEQAREFFLYIQEWVKRAKFFYTIQEHPNDYVQLILDLNELYYYMSMYETDIESQYDVQRRRVEILECLSTALKEMRPQEYLFLSIELLQELAQAQIDLLMLNLRRLTHVQSAGGLQLKDLCQEHNDATRKVEALAEIQRRLGRRESKISLIDMQLFGA